MICENVHKASLHFSHSQELKGDCSEMFEETKVEKKGGKCTARPIQSHCQGVGHLHFLCPTCKVRNSNVQTMQLFIFSLLGKETKVQRYAKKQCSFDFDTIVFFIV